LVYESYIAAFTDSLFGDLFEAHFDKSLLQNECRYVADAGYYWIPSGRIKYDLNKFYYPTEYTDAFGEITKISLDDYALSVVRVEDAIGNINQVTMFHYRTMSPLVMKDLNDNLSAVRFDALNRVTQVFVIGKHEIDQGDQFEFSSLETHENDRPSAHFEYHLNEWYKQVIQPDFDKEKSLPKPNFAKSIAHEIHFLKSAIDYSNRAFISYIYSDGSGHEVLTKVQAEPGMAPERDTNKNLVFNSDGTIKSKSTGNNLRYVGNGKKIVNAKGNVVKEYEPFFDCIPDYNDENELRTIGITKVLYYDALSRLVKTVNPNKTFSKVALDNWMQQVWDENDTVKESGWYQDRQNMGASDADKQAAVKTLSHAETPSVIHLDSLARTFITVASDGLAQQDITTYIQYDLEGNVRSVTDARGNIVMSWKYDMLGNMCFQHSMDAGDRWVLNNVAGNPVRRKDSRNHVFLYTYDKLQRPISSKVTGGEDVILDHVFDKIIYGENQVNAKANNLRGKPALHFDTAGVLTFEKYDFKGNLLKSSRRLCKNYKSVPDWSVANVETLLQGVTKALRSQNEYDALNRVTLSIAPDNSETKPGYNVANLLETVDVKFPDGHAQNIITAIDYNAKGQREKIIYGNGVTTDYEYEPETYRLKKLHSRKGDSKLQLLNYTYDPVGNITRIVDEAIPTKFFNNFKVEPINDYEYDALYRLKSATGKEHIAQVDFGKYDNWNDLPFLKQYDAGNDMQVRPYTEKYEYDKVGNITLMDHNAIGGSWTRKYTYENVNNRLKTTQIGSDDPYQYHHHPTHGFITKLPHLTAMDWNFKDELSSTSMQLRNNGTPETTYYAYDAQGIRIRKVTEYSAGVGDVPVCKEERVYLGSYEVYQSFKCDGTLKIERTSLHAMDDKSRVALIEIKTKGQDDSPSKLIRFQLNNHLGSSCLELDENANVISYEEFHPYGSTAYQAVTAGMKKVAKRYRYTGMERDEESGLNYHNARYYSNWLCQLISSDPIGIIDELNTYRYSHSNPVRIKDTSGLAGEPDVNWHLIQQSALRQPVTATASTPGITQLLRDQYQALGAMWGWTKTDVGHPKPYALTKAGETLRVFPQLADENRSLGATVDKEAVQKARANNEFTRVRSKDLTVTKGTRYGQPAPLQILQGLENQPKIPPTAPPKISAPSSGILSGSSGSPMEQLELPFSKPRSSASTNAKYTVPPPLEEKGMSIPSSGTLLNTAGSTAGNVVRATVPGVIEAEIGLTVGATYANAAGYTTVGAELEVGAAAVPVVGGGLVTGAVVGNLAEVGARKMGASERVAKGTGALAAIASGAGAGALIGAPAGGIGAVPGAIVGGVVGLGGYLISKIF
jgi:RHS repeat-associated protein